MVRPITVPVRALDPGASDVTITVTTRVNGQLQSGSIVLDAKWADQALPVALPQLARKLAEMRSKAAAKGRMMAVGQRVPSRVLDR